MSTALGCNDIEIRESEFVTKTQFLCAISISAFKRNSVYASNSDFLTPISSDPTFSDSELCSIK